MSAHARNYVAGYGSLMSAYSRRVYSQIDVEVVPVEITGWERGWFSRHAEDHATYAGVRRHPHSHMLGVLVPTIITPELRRREKNYNFVRLDHSQIRFPGNPHGAEDYADATIWICENKHTDLPDEKCPVPQTYLDTCLIGAKETGVGGAMAHFVKNMVGWPGPVVDDRHLPLYTRSAKLTDQDREEIDALLEAEGILHHRISRMHG